MKRTTLLMALCCLSALAHAFYMKGKVTDQKHQLLPYAAVFVTDLQIGATTDLDGNYTIRDIPAGQHTIVVSYVGYESQTFQFTLEKDGLHDFVLEEQEVTMNEIFVAPGGQSLERFILDQTVRHTRPLSKVASQFDLSKHIRSEKRGQDIRFVFQPYLKIINPVLSLMGLKSLFHYVLDNPDLRAEVFVDATFRKGSFTMGEPRLGDCAPVPNDGERKGLFKMMRKHFTVGYDETYQSLADLNKNLQKLDKKDPEKAAKILKYVGGYEENGHSVHILRAADTEFHIVDDIWQVRRVATTVKGKLSSCTEFCELGKGLYLPISQLREMKLGYEDLIKDQLKELKEKDLSKMKAADAASTRERIEKMENLLASEGMALKSSHAYVYKNLVLK